VPDLMYMLVNHTRLINISLTLAKKLNKCSRNITWIGISAISFCSFLLFGSTLKISLAATERNQELDRITPSFTFLQRSRDKEQVIQQRLI